MATLTPPRPSLMLVLLCGLMGILWLAGGASRADVSGQAVVRAVTAATLAALILSGARPDFTRFRPVLYLLTAAILLAALQLIPLPPSIWQALPGRQLTAEAAALIGQSQPWRPWSMVPDATLNAAFSLAPPLTILMLTASMRPVDQGRLLPLLLCLVALSALLGFLQFTGSGVGSPFVNYSPGDVSGTFANRNHFALLMAIGCVLTAAWFVTTERSWRGSASLGLVLIFIMTILASGSRTGVITGAVALAFGLLIVQRRVRRMLSHHPRWAFPALIAGLAALLFTVILLAVVADRAVSIERILQSEPQDDLRVQALPTILDGIRTYFPAGSGLGAFDPIFRIHEPLHLVKPVYLNHAHNDWLEIVFDAGLPGLVLAALCVAWWGVASYRAWTSPSDREVTLAKAGSAILLLIMIASAFDYPARTPLMMAVIVVAAMWLSGVGKGGRRSTLLGSGHLI